MLVSSGLKTQCATRHVRVQLDVIMQLCSLFFPAWLKYLKAKELICLAFHGESREPSTSSGPRVGGSE